MSYNYQDAPRESQQEYFGKVHTDNTETLNNALKRIEELEQENAELKEKIEKMTCCGNCKGVCTSYDVACFCKNNDYKLWEIKND